MTRQELACTNCHKIFRFDMDFELDGNHEIICPGCGHIHYRVVVDGKITEVRHNLNYQTYAVTNYYMTGGTSSSTTGGWTGGSTIDTAYSGTGDYFLRDSWLNSTSTY